MRTVLTSTVEEHCCTEITPHNPQFYRVESTSYLDEDGVDRTTRQHDIGLLGSGRASRPGEHLFRCPETGLLDSVRSSSFSCHECHRLLHITALKRELVVDDPPVTRVDEQGRKTRIPRVHRYCERCWKQTRVRRVLHTLFVAPFQTPAAAEDTTCTPSH